MKPMRHLEARNSSSETGLKVVFPRLEGDPRREYPRNQHSMKIGCKKGWPNEN